MDLTDFERDILRLRRRWNVTYDWFNYTHQIQRLHQALLIHRVPWTTRALAAYTNLPQTTVRRQLDEMEPGRAFDRTKDGVQISDVAAAFAVNFHRELSKYVLGGRHIDRDLADLLRKSQNTDKMNWEMIENHVWWPIIKPPELSADASSQFGSLAH